jgi:ATP-binding cassette, subfamily B, multidrug efflux pump
MSDQRTRTGATAEPPLFRFGPGPRPMGKVERAKDTRGTVRRLWAYLARQRRALIITAVLVLATTALNVVGPFLLALAIDRYVATGDTAGLLRISLLMLLVYALTSLFTWLQSYIMTGAAQRTVQALREDLFARLQKLPLRFFDTRQHGDLMSRLTNDVESVNQVLADGVVQIVSGVLGMIGVAAVMLWINPLLTLISVGSVTVMTLVLNRWVAPRTRTGFRRQQAALGTLNGLIEETITGQRVVKAFGREESVGAQFAAANQELRAAATRAQTVAGFVGPMMNAVGNLSLAIVGGVGGWLVLQGTATVGTIAAFITYTRQFGRPLNELANLYNAIQGAIAGAERVFAVIDEPGEEDAPEAATLDAIKGEVVFEEVWFSYGEEEKRRRGEEESKATGATAVSSSPLLPFSPSSPGWVLKGVSLHAAPGQTIALVGPTGAGKTTIVNLLTRFYEIDAGRITIDGRDITSLPKEQLRRQLGIVLQDTFLFSGTVMENIRYGRLDAPDDEVIAAARLANADQFIHRLPQGYGTPLSERAGNLSQGQRQLLAIARAILADPRILILDEATSSVDTRTEQHIQEAMLRLMTGRTSFVIAHRLSTIRGADQILVIDGGRVVERGTHAELLEAQGFYARLYSGQFNSVGRAREGFALPETLPHC